MLTESRPIGCRFGRTQIFLASASAVALSCAGALAQPAPAPAPIVEEVLITGSLIRGAEAVGVPVTALSLEDVQETGAMTIGDLLRKTPALFVTPSTSFQSSVTNFVRAARVDIHNFGPLRTLMLIDGMRFPANNHDASSYDPSIIPSIALQRLDILADGASATYGSDAVAGVVNVILRRNFDGAITQAFMSGADGGNVKLQGAQLYGRKWDTGGITLSFEYFNEKALKGPARSFYTYDFTPYGLDNRNIVKSAVPGIVSTGNPTSATGTSCTNCYSIPFGTGWNYGDTAAHTNPLTPNSAPTTTWTVLLANKGVNNLVNPYMFADILPSNQRTAATATFDQEIFGGVSFFGEGFYSNRRVILYGPPASQPFDTSTFTQIVPTTNPYYPAGAPVGLRANYSLVAELNPYVSSYEISGRYAFGFDVELPLDWQARLFFSTNEERNSWTQHNQPNLNNISAALGNTVTDPDGQVAPFTRPANIPFLNPFCDALIYTCNSPVTLDYVSAMHIDNSHYLRHEWGANFDGPIFDLPGGTVRAAVGANYFRDNFFYTSARTENTVAKAMSVTFPETLGRTVYAGFGQLNIPVFGEANAMPGLHRLEIEISGRYDHYDDFGGTTNPKLAANWDPIEGLTFRGSWGRSFRAPAFGNLSYVLAKRFSLANVAAGAPNNSAQVCTNDQIAANAPATAGSAAAAILQGAGAANCGNAAITAVTGAAVGSAAFNQIRFAGGITQNGGVGLTAGITRPADYVLKPEKAESYTIGADFTPSFFSGLNVHATYFHTLIKDVIANGCGDVNDPICRDNIMVRANPDGKNRAPFGDPLDPAAPGAISALTRFTSGAQAPAGVAPFVPSVRYLTDGAIYNLGSEELAGTDFGASYDWDMGNFGTGSIGLQGTYMLRDKTVAFAGAAPSDPFVGNNNNAGIGNVLTPRLRYRGDVGWEGLDGFSVTLAVNYQAHYFHTNVQPPSPPPNYSNLVPSQYTFDLSVGYNTMDNAVNPYLNNIAIRVVANNLLDRLPPFVYRIATGGGVTAYDGTIFSPIGRTISLSITKTW
jgi:outer membrane receptor protein involved in Fe transport